MLARQKSTTSMKEKEHIKKRKRYTILQTKNKLFANKLPIGVSIGIFLTLFIIVIQCIAFFTPHWKEISPNTHSLYVDGVDALIRTEILHYFNSVHRYTRQSYGLFQRCEYLLNNSSKYSNQENVFDKPQKSCTKNFLPSYDDEHFNECHSLPYYKFCTKASEKNFDINNDYLRATFDISYSSIKSGSKISCDCHYPPYVSLCHVVGILALIFLIITCLLFSSFLFFTDTHYRLKMKFMGVVSSILAIIFLLINLITILQHLEYESAEYLIAIQRHYKLNQIYKLSQDTKTVIDRFLSSIQIHIGYSTILAWIAFGLSIIDGILLAICKFKYESDETDTGNLIPSNDGEHHSPLKFRAMSSESQALPPVPARPNSQNDKIRILNEDEV
jgi:hypothetical protein